MYHIFHIVFYIINIATINPCITPCCYCWSINNKYRIIFVVKALFRNEA